MTAGVAAPAYAGIPVTHRDAASAVAFVTGHEDPAKDGSALDWEALARFPGTLVFYMGIKNLPLIAERLAAAGRDPGQAAAVVARGTLAGQRDRGGHARGHRRRGGRGAACARRRSPWSGRSPSCATRSPGWSGGRCTARWWPSRGRARRRAGWPAGCASSAPRWSRRPRSGSSRAPSTLPDHAALLARCASPARTACACSSTRWSGRDARALAAHARRGDRPGHGRRAARARHRRRRGAGALRRRGPAGGARGGAARRPARCSSRGRPRRATCCPTACASAAPRWTSWRSTTPSPEPLGEARGGVGERRRT